MSILSLLKIGQKVVIEKINTTHEKKIKLLGLGINTGSKISILRNRGGDMVIALGNARVSIGRTMANLIEVREL
ncbi:FeoA domain-containing protein [uncultured Candidatus Thioglobus sp.]|jgi:ferrous iron transport protein A|uniref:FeoA family protein n=1 Tax=uncultured Candidatus Thioglobus sp. TaxID=655186 RepID=UPI002A515D70|nr:ferrous iron transport protein A [Candidatus Thioglobus sp.]MBT6328085.1 ferrous iron transport protein A [Candidatus Thioglobus sp.]MBT7294844.1 ferrous iron transport protein A [Candidatus Thioglobus sp.]MBT7498986.1 ferrous iron transport protein A [Candidatus Thioglobus sp.]